jgi:tRNA-specific 2-thiouridylase
MNGTKLNSLGFPKPPEQTRVVVAMSGGVDSSVCAAMLHEQGYEVIGVTMQLHDNKKPDADQDTPSCTGQDLKDVQRIASELGFTHHVLNFKNNFQALIIDEFADSYLRGETPIPCVRCNQSIKFGDMLDFARSIDADCMVTGHYIRREVDKNGRAYLMRGTDTIKDQSYFLFSTSQEQLDYLRFPLGSLCKDNTREQARALGLITANKPESQDICFVPDGDYANLVKSLRPNASNPGKIMHIDGRKVGEHKGIIHYTIGQRKGLGIGGGVSENNEPLYVIAIKPEENQVIVGPKEALARDTLHINECNWLFDKEDSRRSLANTQDDTTISIQIMVKFRSVMKPTPAILQINNETNTAKIYLETPQYGIAKGQAAVCYINDRMIGGGWIIGTSSRAT